MANDPKAWRISEDKFFPCEDATPTLPAGHYDLRSSHNTGVYLRRAELKTDSLIAGIDPISKSVIGEIEEFWHRKENFKRLGMLWKRGFFFWGSPGGGKTSLVNLICQWVIEHDGITIYVEYPNMVSDALKQIRSIEPERPIVLILEDLDDMFREFSESTILNILDGEAQVDNVIILATANNPERLKKRVLNRPGRFDFVYRIGLPNAASRRAYIVSKAPEMEGNEDLETWVTDTKGLSVAHLRDLLVSVIGMGQDYKKVLDKLLDMNSQRPDDYVEPDAEEDREPFGFARGMKEHIDTENLDLEVRRNDESYPITEPSIWIEDD